MKPLPKDSLVAKQYPEHRVADPQRPYFSIVRRYASRRAVAVRIAVDRGRTNHISIRVALRDLIMNHVGATGTIAAMIEPDGVLDSPGERGQQFRRSFRMRHDPCRRHRTRSQKLADRQVGSRY